MASCCENRKTRLLGRAAISDITLHQSVLAAFWIETSPSHDAAARMFDRLHTGELQADLLDYSETQALVSAVQFLRLTTATPLQATRFVGHALALISALEQGRRVRRVAARPLLQSAASLAIEHDLSLGDALTVAQAGMTGSTLAIADPNLAFPLEVLQASLPRFVFELLV